MRRYTLIVWGSMALSASTLIPVLNSAIATAADGPTATAPAAAGKKLFSVPEDGSGNDDLPASSRLVRDIIQARSNEDLIICIAGCIPGTDRVVYAQPIDPESKKKEPVVSDAQAPAPAAATQAEPVPQTEPAPVAKAAEPAPAGEPVKDAAEEKPATEPAAAEAPASDGAGHMEPTAADPSPAETAPASDTPSNSEAPVEETPSEMPERSGEAPEEPRESPNDR